ncbi:adenosylcobinamide amidohydrolase [Bacillaceae bacterium]
MMKPFRERNFFRSAVWPEIAIAYRRTHGKTARREDAEHLLIRSERLLQTCSSALWGGGFAQASHFVNWKVSQNYASAQPEEELRKQIISWGYPADFTVGLQTAASLKDASIAEEAGDQFRLLCCVTAGTGNAARAGRERRTFSAYRCGTINIFLLFDGRLTPSAMINGVITATEAKTAALQDLRIFDDRGEFATGTTTDAIVLAASQNESYGAVHRFAGAATTLGNAIGRLVYRSVCEAVKGENGAG